MLKCVIIETQSCVCVGGGGSCSLFRLHVVAGKVETVHGEELLLMLLALKLKSNWSLHVVHVVELFLWDSGKTCHNLHLQLKGILINTGEPHRHWTMLWLISSINIDTELQTPYHQTKNTGCILQRIAEHFWPFHNSVYDNHWTGLSEKQQNPVRKYT